MGGADKVDKDFILVEGEFSARFVDEVLKVFPELRDEFDLDYGLHMRMSTVARAIMGAIERRAFDSCTAMLDWIAAALDANGTPGEFENAVAMSFLMPSVLRKTQNGQRVLETMPARIRELIVRYEETMDEFHRGPGST